MCVGGGGTGGGCLTHDCKYDKLIIIVVGAVIGGICALICICALLVRFISGRPLRANSRFIRVAAYDKLLEMENDLIFHSGTWFSKYYQYRKWHGPHRLTLNFDPTQMTVSGTGCDDVGTFKITGLYSTKTQRLGLTKTYKSGTGNLKENLGHTVTIQLHWNPRNKQFEGKWYVQTRKYRGENVFELKLSNKQQSSIYLKV